MSKQNLLEELRRFNEINKYVKTLINEQDLPPVDPAALPVDTTAGTVPPVDTAAVPPTDPTAVPPTDTTNVPPVEGETSDEPDTTEEIDITDLVNMTKSIKKDLEDRNVDNGNNEKMDQLFSKLNDLETKLQGMDELITKIDNLEIEVKNSKPKSPEEKLEMRSLDSYPFNENPQQFFDQKLDQMRMTGKNEYILTKDDVENYSKNEIMKSFNPNEDNRY